MRNGILSVRRFRIWVVGGIKYGRLVYQRNLGSGLGRVENHWKFRSGKNFEERCHRHHLITIISRSSQYQSNYLHHYHIISIISVIVIINVIAFVVEITNIVIVSIIDLLFFFCRKSLFVVVLILQNTKILPLITLGTYFQSGVKHANQRNCRSQAWFPSKLDKNGCLWTKRFETALYSSIILVRKKKPTCGLGWGEDRWLLCQREKKKKTANT